MKIISIYGGPGSGKSTTAAGVFHKMKLMGHKCELVREVVKTPVYAGRSDLFELQEYIFALQNYEMHVLRNKVDYVITDAPLLMSAIYGAENDKLGLFQTFEPFIRAVYNTYDNFNVFLNRAKPYQQYGRFHTEAQAEIIDHKIKTYLDWHEIPYWQVGGDEHAVDAIIQRVLRETRKEND